MTRDVGLPPELAERFEVAGILGQGAFGRVLRARDRQLGRTVAIKLLVTAFDDKGSATRFHREALASAQLSHPSLVEIYDHGIAACGQRYLIYEFVEGEVLEEHEGRADARKVRRWGAGLAAALAEAHAAGILHRDVKPANIVIDASDRARLLDFGLARTSSQGTRLTATGALVGTPYYMAPEVIQGSLVTAAADQFALAATLYGVARGEPAFSRNRLPDLLAGKPSEPPLPAPELFEEDPELHAVLTRALAPHPADRWADCGALAAALARPPSLSSSTQGARPRPPGSPRQGWKTFGGAALGVALLVALGQQASSTGPTTPTPPAPPSSKAPDLAAALAPFDKALERLEDIHPTSQATTDVHVLEALEVLLDPRLSMAMRRVRLATGELAPMGDAPRMKALDRILTHLRHDLEMLALIALGLQGEVLTQGMQLMPRNPQIQARRGEVLRELSALSLQLEPYVISDEEPGTAVLHLWAMPMDDRDPERCVEASLRLARALPRCSEEAEVRQWLLDIELLVHSRSSVPRGTPSQLRDVVATMLESANTMPARIHPDFQAQVAVHALDHAIRNCTMRSEPPTPRDLAAIASAKEVVASLARGLTARARRVVGVQVALDAGQRSRQLQAHHPGLQAQLGDLLELARELQTP